MKSLNSDTTIIFSANIGEIIVIGGILVIVVIAYSKYVSEHWEKGKNQFKEIWLPHKKKLTLWERIRLLYRNPRKS